MSESDLLFQLHCLQRGKAKRRFRRDIFESWSTGCCYCGCEDPKTLDHILAKCRGGETVRANLAPACRKCNLAKSDSDWFTWYRAQDFWTYEREMRLLSWINQRTVIQYDEVYEPGSLFLQAA